MAANAVSKRATNTFGSTARLPRCVQVEEPEVVARIAHEVDGGIVQPEELRQPYECRTHCRGQGGRPDRHVSARLAVIDLPAGAVLRVNQPGERLVADDRYANLELLVKVTLLQQDRSRPKSSAGGQRPGETRVRSGRLELSGPSAQASSAGAPGACTRSASRADSRIPGRPPKSRSRWSPE